MEETLGKRIVRHRKALGLTQDQLAEQLGVTAQAVSKWENDQSCPDISMLPKLSGIFGITTDQLLGSAPEHSTPTYEAEVVTDREPEGLHIGKDGWEFHWDSGRKGALSFALLVLAVGVQLVLAQLLPHDISFWSILWPTAFMVFGINGLYGGFSAISLGSLLLGTWFLLDNWGLLPVQFGGNLVFPALVVVFGISLLIDALKKPKKPHFQFTHNGNRGSDSLKNDFSVDGEHFEYNAKFGDTRQDIQMHRLSGGKIHCAFGDYTVDLSGVEEVSGNCLLEANCSFGELTVLVPRHYAVRQTNTTAFANFEISGQPETEPKGIISLRANASFGEIQVKYI